MATNLSAGLNDLPFRQLSSFELEELHLTSKQFHIKQLEDNGFTKFFKTQRNDLPTSQNPAFYKQYYEPDELNTTMSNKGKATLSLCHLNIRRLCKNQGKLSAFFSSMIDTSFDIIILTEVGDNADDYLNHNLLEEYEYSNNLHDLPIGNKYGGVAILVKKGKGKIIPRPDLKICQTCNCEKCKYENIWIELKSEDESFIIGGIYRHPNGNINHFSSDLEHSLTKIDKNANTIIAGDINIDLNKYEEKTTFDYFTVLTANMFVPYILTPTRITDYKHSTIDHICV